MQDMPEQKNLKKKLGIYLGNKKVSQWNTTIWWTY